MRAFDKIIGYAAEKKELKQVADVLANPDIYRALGLSAPQGLLLFGEPGVGKTLMAQCLIEASGRQAFTCRKDKPNGDFIKDIKEKFVQAAKYAPSIVFLDDMDKFANGDEEHEDAEEYVTVQSCIDEVKGKEVFVLATANSTRALPRSLLRAGRFDRQIQISAPQGADAIAIISHYLKGKAIMGDVDAAYIAKLMNGHSCADVETVINEAGALAGYERASAITLRHFVEAFLKREYHSALAADCNEDDCDDPIEPARRSERQIEHIAYHEAGHALIAEMLLPGCVTLVSIHAGSGNHEGLTAVWETPGKSMAKQERQIMISLGGMAAVTQHFGAADIGNASDLRRAFEILHDMIAENCAFGFAHFESSQRANSEQFYHAREQIAAAEMERYYRKVKEMLLQNSVFFNKLVQTLMKKHFLTTADIREIKENCAALPRAL